MTYKEARVYLDDMSKYGSVLGLGPIRKLLCELGNPQDDLKFIHIAGTNGKGSVLAYISTILQKAGYRVGRYISPTVVSYLERIQVDARLIPEDAFARLTSMVQKAIARMEAAGETSPTVFEAETAIAFLYFKEQRCDLAVLECGLGGETDATNIIEHTLLAVFTSISRDHLGILGNTLEEIARIKSGIVKPGCTVVTACQQPEVMKILTEQARKFCCPAILADPGRAQILKEDYTGQTFSYPLSDAGYLPPSGAGLLSPSGAGYLPPSGAGYLPPSGAGLLSPSGAGYLPPSGAGLLSPSDAGYLPPSGSCGAEYPDADIPADIFRCSLAGRHQVENAVAAIEAVRALHTLGYSISSDAVRQGLVSAAWPGRLTCLLQKPLFFIDGAHNEAAARKLRESMEIYFPGKRLVYITGVFKDKEYEKIAGIMGPLARSIHTVDLPDTGRTLPAGELAEVMRRHCAPDAAVQPEESIKTAVHNALREAHAEDIVLAFGSLSYLGKIMEILSETEDIQNYD